MIWTVRVKLIDFEGEWSADIEIESTSTLDDLHLAIQKAVQFDNDHLYAFYIARTARSRRREYIDDEDGDVYIARLDELLPLDPKRSLFYLFDFGDSWLFKVVRTRKRPSSAKRGITYPRVVAETGERPVQYPDY